MPTSTTIPLNKLGRPGTRGNLTILDVFDSETRIDQDRLRDSSRREIKIAALLSRAPSSTETINLSAETERGGSYIYAHPNAAKTLIKCRERTVELRHNMKHELSSLHFKCLATSPTEARRLFLDTVSPFIDHVSYLGNVPLYITLTECYDAKNHSRTYDYVNPHPHVTINPHEATLHKRLLPVYALYREAKNAQSVFYKFLCYYKILEGIYNHLRPEVFADAKSRGILLVPEKEIIPDDSELRSTHPNIIGKPVKQMLDHRFTPLFRNKVAHYILSEGAILNVSQPQATERFGAEILPMEICVRTVIATQERYELQVGK